MTNASGGLTGAQVARILYKQIVEGDLRKIQAQSNDSDTGGGARDFRFGSYKRLLPIIRQMFPRSVKETRKRGGMDTLIDVYEGDFYWQPPNSKVLSRRSYFEPATDVRPNEGRIVRVHEYPCFDLSLIPALQVGNRILLLLVQRGDGTVWPHFVEESSLRTPGVWEPAVAEEICKCLDAQRRTGLAVIGSKDFVSGEHYCNGN